jgi:hypothetical protein
MWCQYETARLCGAGLNLVWRLPESRFAWHDLTMVFFKARSSARDNNSDQARIAALIRQINEVRAGV